MALVNKSSAIAVSENVDGEKRRRERSCENLIEQLQSDCATERRWAARDLQDCPGSESALIERLWHERDLSVREVILTSITHIGSDISVAELVKCLRSGDASLRNEAIEAMKQLPKSVAPIMHLLLADEDSDVRIFAVNVLESLRHEDVESWLIEVISNDPHVNVCATAVDLLGEVGTEACKVALEDLKQRFSDEPYIQFAADLAIKRVNPELTDS